jgi:Sec-independent protein translocase protein TatA
MHAWHAPKKDLMFGFGYLEIIVVAALLVLVIGIGPARKLFDTIFGVYREVEKTKQEIRQTFSLGGLFRRKNK